MFARIKLAIIVKVLFVLIAKKILQNVLALGNVARIAHCLDVKNVKIQIVAKIKNVQNVV